MANNYWKDWLEREKKILNGTDKKPRKRTYIHFDERRKLSPPFLYYLRDFLNDPNCVAKTSFFPFLRIIIKFPRYKKIDARGKRKIEDKEREIYKSAHFDSLIYSWYGFIMNEKYSEELRHRGLDDVVLAYRKIAKDDGSGNKCNIHFANEVFNFIRNKKECVAFVSDITKFFDTLNHDILKKNWSLILHEKELPKDHYNIFKSLTKFCFVNEDEVLDLFKYKKNRIKKGKENFFIGNSGRRICSIKDFREKVKTNNLLKINGAIENGKRTWNDKGIVQGSPISAVLSNIYMIDFDKEVNDYIKSIGGLYRRYSDDIVVVCEKNDYRKTKEFIRSLIEKKYKLEINEEKIDTTFFKIYDGVLKGFTESDFKQPSKMQYLGFEFDGVYTTLRSKSLSKYYRTMRRATWSVVKMAKGKKSKTKNQNNKIYKKRLFERFLYNKDQFKTYLPKGEKIEDKRNFISYAQKAAKEMDSNKINRQIRHRFDIINKTIKYKTKKWERKDRIKKIIKAKKVKNLPPNRPAPAGRSGRSPAEKLEIA